jgi:hypothetical protein
MLVPEAFDFRVASQSHGAPWLTVLVAKPEHLLAMKLLAARPGADDINDVIALATKLRMTKEESSSRGGPRFWPCPRSAILWN